MVPVYTSKLCRRCHFKDVCLLISVTVSLILLAKNIFDGACPALKQGTTVSQQSSKKQLILLTYGRSGSTFTSAIISHHARVFYTCEPLHKMPPSIYAEYVPKMVQMKALETIDAFLDCDFKKLDTKLLRDWQFSQSSSTIQLHSCLKEKNMTSYEYLACFLAMAGRCASSDMVFIKTLRFRSDWAEAYFRRYPNLKILFLIRDFRAVLYSQAKHFGLLDLTDKKQVASKAKSLCSTSLTDFTQLRRLRSLFPGRVKGIRYEDGCTDPQGYARALYHFAGLHFSELTQRFVSQITHSNRSGYVTRRAYGSIKKNSLAAMNAWRQQAQLSIVAQIDEHCVQANLIFGYKPVTSEEQLRSENASLLTNPAADGLF